MLPASAATIATWLQKNMIPPRPVYVFARFITAHSVSIARCDACRETLSFGCSRRVRGNDTPAPIAPDEHVGEPESHGLRRRAARRRFSSTGDDRRIAINANRQLIDA